MSSIRTIIGDPHAKNKNLHIIESIMAQVETLGHDCIWMGDMLDTKEIVRGNCLNAWIRYFRNSPLNHVVLVGNHDFFNLDCKDHSLEALKDLPNVKIIDEPSKIGKHLYIPYIHEEKELRDALKLGDKGSILFGHLELKGFDFGNGHICESGLTSKSFTKFKKVISGHFHKFQEKSNLVYIGTPFSHSFGESNQVKYIATIDLETANLALIHTDLPQHVTVEIDLNESPEMRPDISNKDNFYRVILTGSEQNINMFPRDEFIKLNEEGFSVKIITRPELEFDDKVVISDTDSNEGQFSSWARDIEGLDEETIALGVELLGNARVK